jgi:hypothetical protein
LTIVESSVTDAYVAVDALGSPPANVKKSSASSEAADNLLEPEFEIITYKPITSSLRSTVLHLRSRAGYWSRFRGLSLFLCWGFVRSIIISLVGSVYFMRSQAGLAIAAIIADVALSRWELTWYHIVISEPSPKKWWQRMPSFKSRAWAKIAPAVALRSLTTQIASGFPMLLCRSFGTMKHLQDPAFQLGKKDMYALFGQSLIILFLTFALFILLEIPATVTAVRVAASMLPEEYETIVPFDRSFGGKVTPAIVGGAGKIGMLEAWKSFTWSSRIRLLKLVFKVFSIIVAVWLLFSMLVIGEAHLFLGDDLGKIIKAIGGKSN